MYMVVTDLGLRLEIVIVNKMTYAEVTITRHTDNTYFCLCSPQTVFFKHMSKLHSLAVGNQ